MKHTLLNPNPSEDLKSAIRRFELGLYNNACAQLLEVLGKEPGNADALFYFRLIERKLAKHPHKKPTLVWQFNPAAAWESDWLRMLLSDTIETEIVDGTWSHITDPMIVVDNRLVPEKTSYYREAFAKGVHVILVHLSDEAFKDDQGAYKYCDAVIRNYHSERLAECADVFFLPLGYKAGFAKPGHEPKPATARKYLWSFAGDGKKLTRTEMLHEMGQLPDGFKHLTSNFGSSDALSTDAYRALLDNTVFVPSPSGWSNLESFRVYEALEAGCIPIVEQRMGFDYFTTLLGSHPIPTVTTWAKGAELVRQLQSTGHTERVRLACAAWWQTYKPQLTAALTSFIVKHAW